MNGHRSWLAWLLFSLTAAGAAYSQATADPAAPHSVGAPLPLEGRVAERVRSEMTRQSLVGISVALARGAAVVYTAGFGQEDREAGVAATPETRYRWASVSKPMTAVVAMQLSVEGKLDLDGDVRAYVPEFPERSSRITARQLLGHLGGIVHYENGPVIRTRREYTQPHPFEDTVVALDCFMESPLVCVPGAKFSYTTHGYMLLGAVEQRAGGKPYRDLVLERVAAPCGMRTLRPDYPWEAIPHRAAGYRAQGKKGESKPVRCSDEDVSWKLPGGGWISTAEDMARFGVGMLGEELVDRDTRALMWTRQRTTDGEETGYGLGFGLGTHDGRLRVSHSGSQNKTATFLLIDPEAPGGGVVVAVMCNTEGAGLSELSSDLAAMLEGVDPDPAP